MVFSGAFILPHGSMILEPGDTDHGSRSLNSAMIDTGKIIAEINPDTIFFTSPHGISHSNDFGVYLNSTLEGNAEWEGKYEKYQVKVKIDIDLSEKYLLHLKKNNCHISGITCFSGSIPAIARWGEAVPLWFLNHLKSEYVVLSQPTRRYKLALEMIPELLKIGEISRKFFDSQDRKILAVISADLAHTHGKTGPFGFSDKAEEFDSLIERWVHSLDQEILVNRAGAILDQALSCGFPGFVILQGMLKKEDFKAEVLANEHPAYYGMLVASFLEKNLF